MRIDSQGGCPTVGGESPLWFGLIGRKRGGPGQASRAPFVFCNGALFSFTSTFLLEQQGKSHSTNTIMDVGRVSR
ncbi:hypothetical protein [Pasteuria penetrans]|uniref:hypothetical protein n=1 Tax=Pasteuria penetrans TaxID=86005 RepID=UPI000FA4847A|nr:hypothetical protein [Pasteuria penetrans]